MRNSSLVEWFCAENSTGLKSKPKLGLRTAEQSSSKERVLLAKRVNSPEGKKAEAMGFVQ